MSKVIPFPRRNNLNGKDPQEKPSFNAFHMEVVKDDLERAELLLVQLLQCDIDIARSATAFYADNIMRDPEHVRVTMGLHELINGGMRTDAILTLQQAFGVSAAEATAIYSRFSMINER